MQGLDTGHLNSEYLHLSALLVLIGQIYKTVCVSMHVVTYSWSRTPVAAWPSNCCCCRMLSKSSMRCSEFSMWAGRWQLRKQMVWPNTDMRALTPPLFPYDTDRQMRSYYINEELLIEEEGVWMCWTKINIVNNGKVLKASDWYISVFIVLSGVHVSLPQENRKFTH